MMDCRFCGRDSHNGGKTHSDGCPAEQTNRIQAEQIWKQGWDDGRTGLQPIQNDRTYSLGWIRGDAAADESQNSVPWSA